MILRVVREAAREAIKALRAITHINIQMSPKIRPGRDLRFTPMQTREARVDPTQ
jgi:hypothetical protein